jgi:uncharacterized membrane-anchored protein YjiN (DUF445 family)
MRLIIVTLFLIAAMCFIATIALITEGEFWFGFMGSIMGFVSLRFAGYLECHYGN